MTKRTMVCETCGATTRRESTFCTVFEPALCPAGHGPMVEQDKIGRQSSAARAKAAKAERAARVGKKKR